MSQLSCTAPGCIYQTIEAPPEMALGILQTHVLAAHNIPPIFAPARTTTNIMETTESD